MEETAAFDEFAPDYENIHNQSIALSGEESIFFVELKIKLLQQYFYERKDENLIILDYGCGTGRSAPFVKRYFPKSQFIGVDPSPKSIEVAQQQFPEHTFMILNKESKDNFLAQPKADIIFAAGVFHHILETEQAPALEQLNRALKPNGKVVLFEHNPYNPLTVRVVRSCPFDEGVTLLKPSRTRTLMAKANLMVEHQRYYFFFPKFLSFLRPTEKLLQKIPLGAQYMLVGRKK